MWIEVVAIVIASMSQQCCLHFKFLILLYSHNTSKRQMLIYREGKKKKTKFADINPFLVCPKKYLLAALLAAVFTPR